MLASSLSQFKIQLDTLFHFTIAYTVLNISSRFAPSIIGMYERFQSACHHFNILLDLEKKHWCWNANSTTTNWVLLANKCAKSFERQIFASCHYPGDEHINNIHTSKTKTNKRASSQNKKTPLGKQSCESKLGETKKKTLSLKIRQMHEKFEEKWLFGWTFNYVNVTAPHLISNDLKY